MTHLLLRGHMQRHEMSLIDREYWDYMIRR
jgi:hypothetical protein